MTHEEIDQEIQRASELIELGRTDQALSALGRLIVSEPAAAGPAELLMAVAQLRAKRLPESIRHAEASLRADPEHAPTYTVLASGLQLSGRSRDAIHTLQRGLELDPTMADAYCLGAQALSDLKAHHDAENWARTALQLTPADADAHFARGDVLHDLRPAPAEEADRAPLQREPEHMQAMQNLATLRARQGDRRGATHILADVLAGTRGSQFTLTLLDTLVTQCTLRAHRLTFIGVFVSNMIIAGIANATRPNPWPGTLAGLCLMSLVMLGILAWNRTDLSALRESLPRQGAGFFRGYPKRNPVAAVWLALIALGWTLIVIGLVAGLIGAIVGNPDAPLFVVPAGGITIFLMFIGAALSWIHMLLTNRRLKRTRQL